MIDVEPKDLTTREIFSHLHGGIAPRPIALVSTLSADGVPNLAPFSFYNVFGGNPPTVAFSPARRQRDGKFKDTYYNLVTTRECVVQAVTYAMVEQVNLASAEFGADVDEFAKSGLTTVASDIVKPPRVAESPFQMECVLRQMIILGSDGGSGNLTVCEVVKFHISEEILRGGHIAPELIDHVGRNGADYYTHAAGAALFRLTRPNEDKVIGYDALPQFVKQSNLLTANNLARLATFERIPSVEEAAVMFETLPDSDDDGKSITDLESARNYRGMMRAARRLSAQDGAAAVRTMERAAKCALEEGDVEFAWKALVYVAREQRNEIRK